MSTKIEWTDATWTHYNSVNYGADNRRCSEDCGEESWSFARRLSREGGRWEKILRLVSGVSSCVGVRERLISIRRSLGNLPKVSQCQEQAIIPSESQTDQGPQFRACAQWGQVSGPSASELFRRGWYFAASQLTSMLGLRTCVSGEGATA